MALGIEKFMRASHAKYALFFFATRGFNFATWKTNLDTPVQGCGNSKVQLVQGQVNGHNVLVHRKFYLSDSTD